MKGVHIWLRKAIRSREREKRTEVQGEVELQRSKFPVVHENDTDIMRTF